VAVLSPELRSSMGVIDFLYRLPIGFDQFVANGSALRGFPSVTLVVLFLGMIGWLTRLVVPLGGLCYFLLGGVNRQYTHLYHQGLVPLYLMAVLSFTPCGDGWSVDRLWNIFRDRPKPKTKRGKRVVLLPEEAATAIRLALLWKREQKMRLGEKYRDS
jgi:hypothetical protein